MFSLTLGARLAVLAFVSLTSAQQYAGETIENSLPGVPGSELAYFNIINPSGDTSVPLTLINYMSLNSTDKRVDGAKVQRAVIVVHGLQRDPGTYMSNMLSALSQNPHDEVNFDSVAICAPYFPNGDDKGTGYPWTDGLPAGEGSTSSALVWAGSQWSGGSNNQYPWNMTTISSYEALDQLIGYFADESIYPNMKQIVVSGHSLGGQTVNRYAAVANKLNINVPVSYWVGNPNSYLWFDDDRPLDTSSCDDYDDWKNGLSNYNNTYGADLVAEGPEAVLALYNSRTIAYGRGVRDTGDDSMDCGPSTTGQNRNERFFNFIYEFPPSCDSVDACSTIDYVNTGHDASAMFASSAGQARLFTDNWSGNGTRAYDMGYPRLQNGDDPYPNPAFEGSGPTVDTKVYAGGMTYQGCYTDSSTRTLGYTAYSSDSNTPDMCTEACNTAGYAIAGTEYGVQCYCGNSIGSESRHVIDEGCHMACGGNSSAICGDSNRLSIYSDGSPSGGSGISLGASSVSTQTKVSSSTSSSTSTSITTTSVISTSTSSTTSTSAKITSTSTTISTSTSTTSTSTSSTSTTVALPSGITSLGCYVDSNTRSLPNSAGTSTSNTPSSCALSCRSLGYKYAGTEYSDECWCGNTLPSSAPSSDCALTCSGDASEICGGNFYLSVTEDTTWVQTLFAVSSFETWNLVACYEDNSTGSRTLATGLATTGGSTNMTVANCMDACANAGLTYCGLEYAQECYGSSTAPDSSLALAGNPLVVGCDYVCTGDSSEACGGSDRLLVYINNGTAA